MGWGRFLLLGDLGQQLDLQDHRREVDDLRAELAQQEHRDLGQDERIRQLEHEVREMKLYVFALLRMMESKSLLSREDVRRLVESVDRDDTDPQPPAR